ncbi:MAG: Uma2 family endonuclease [Arhodomonas sp.]|nr:Uma2 family endonuclease [Arhodomonas sp.]
MGLPVRDHDYHTYADDLRWDDDARYELIDGLAYAMAPAPMRVHQEVVGEIFRQAANALEDQRCRVFVAPLDVRLPKAGEADDEVDTVVQPDVLAVCDPERLDERGVRGAPDWVVEVLSPATAGHDQIHKRRVYERAGVTELWLVHPMDRVLTIYRLCDGEYGKPEITELTGETAVGAVPGVSIDWEALAEILPVLGP